MSFRAQTERKVLTGRNVAEPAIREIQASVDRIGNLQQLIRRRLRRLTGDVLEPPPSPTTPVHDASLALVAT